MEPATGFEPVTCWLQISCSTNWATPALYFSSGLVIVLDKQQETQLVERETRVELATYSLEGCRSANWAIPAQFQIDFSFWLFYQSLGEQAPPDEAT